MEIRQCGNDWRYCDGNCSNCSISKTFNTNRTDVKSFNTNRTDVKSEE